MWLIVSLINGKMHRGRIINFTSLFTRVLTSNFISISILALVMYLLREYSYSRTVVFGTAILATFLELLFGSVYIAYKKALVQDTDEYDRYKIYKRPSEYDLVMSTNGNGFHHDAEVSADPGIIKAIETECGPEMAEAVLRITGPKLTDRAAVLSTTTAFNIKGLSHEKYDYIINLHRLNDIRNLNTFFDVVNSKLEMKGYYFCCVETKDQRKERLLKKYPPS